MTSIPSVKFGEDPRYTIPVAAVLAGTTPITLRRWLVGTPPAHDREPQPSVIPDDWKTIEGHVYASFYNVVEAGFLAAYRNLGAPMQRIRRAVENVRGRSENPRPLLGENFKKLGKDLLYEFESIGGVNIVENVSSDGQIVLRDIVETHFDSIEYDRHGPILMWLTAHRTIGITPSVGFGYPIIVRTGLRTDAVFAAFSAGEEIPDIADDYSITTEEVSEAIRWETEALRRAA